MKGRSHGAAWLKPQRISDSKVDAVNPRDVATDAGFLVIWTESSTGGSARLAMKLLPRQ
jgi:hypothetical protein